MLRNDLIEATKEVLKDKDTARQFLLGVGIIDRDGNLAELYRTEEPVSEELEEAANKYIKGNYSPWLYKAMFDCFKAGANWQKEKIIKED